MGRVYGYARCSTDERRQDVERQTAELYAAGASFVVREYGSASSLRPGLLELVGAMAPGDELRVTELSRVSRSVHDLCHAAEAAVAGRLLLSFGGFGFDARAGRPPAHQWATLHLMGAFAELERNLAAERIASGLAKARAGGKRLGRAPLAPEDLPAAARLSFGEVEAGAVGMTEWARRLGVCRPTAYKWAKLLRGARA